MECLNNLINDYELWHDALAVKIPDAQRAFAYKKLVVGLSERIGNQMEHKINYIETRALMKNTNLAQTDPIALITKAANIVLRERCHIWRGFRRRGREIKTEVGPRRDVLHSTRGVRRGDPSGEGTREQVHHAAHHVLGFAQFVRKLGLEVELMDNDPKSGGGDAADITNEDVYTMHCESASCEESSQLSLRHHHAAPSRFTESLAIAAATALLRRQGLARRRSSGRQPRSHGHTTSGLRRCSIGACSCGTPAVKAQLAEGAADCRCQAEAM